MIHVSNLNKSFGGVKALSDIDLHIERGEMVALIGSSGSGKSTLMRHICGLTAGDRESGQIMVNGCLIQEQGRINRNIRELRTHIGVIFQQFNLVGRLSVARNVCLGALSRTPFLRGLFGHFAKEDLELTHKALERVGIADKAWQRTSTLSGGQQQRAAIARALVQRAEVMLADEPIASLDPESARVVMSTLQELNRTDGITVVVTLHQVDYAIQYCPRTVALKKGRIVYDGPTANLTRAMLKTLYGSESDDLFGRKEEAPTIAQGAAA
ncbi:MAG TPA: phosphonate ABC transporter ATP-binding protein [Candidatus Desulfovibrio intestinipullorum]|uniref:Phosphonate ABC transporter ATP-binding protein n=1 Tax=Candidatus Desulfovibrio intestinipullorum TaxID=2838536 RepID=A0A9D1PZ87_9BACT|nr:phosphonate ABC transporter ATP-binding protein [Candidatus Desulfovibrio intestinipullorum]